MKKNVVTTGQIQTNYKKLKTIRTFTILTEFHKKRRADKKFAAKWGIYGAYKWARQHYEGYQFKVCSSKATYRA